MEAARGRYPGYFYDIKKLVALYMREGSPFSFKDFKELWKRLKFSYIHHAKPKDMDYNEWMQRLYSSTLGFLYSPQPLLVLVGTLYCLYTLYNTQLCKKPRAPIRVSLETWQYLQRLYAEIKNQRIWEAYHVFRKLCDDKSFCYTAYAPVGPRSAPSASLHMLTELPADLQQADTLRNVVDLEAIDKIARIYNTAKERAQGTVAPEAEASDVPQGELNVADVHLGNELRAMLSEIERAYQTSERTTQPAPAFTALRSPARPTAPSLPSAPSFAQPTTPQPDAAQEAAKRKALFDQKFAANNVPAKRPRLAPADGEPATVALPPPVPRRSSAAMEPEELLRSAKAMDELLAASNTTQQQNAEGRKSP